MGFENSTSNPINTTSNFLGEDILSPGMMVIFYALILLSILGCIFNLIATFLLKHHRNVLGKMIILLSINDLIFMIAFGVPFLGIWIGNIYRSIIQKITWSGSVFWVCCFAHALSTSVKVGEECLTNSLLKKYVCSSLIVSVFGSLLVKFGVESLASEERFSLLFYLIVGIPSIIYCTACYITVFKRLRKGQGRDHLELLLYPLILIICELGVVIPSLYLIFEIENNSMILYDLTLLCIMSRGIWNPLAYGLSSKIRNGFKALCRRENGQQQKRPSESQFSLIAPTDFSGSQIRRVTTLKDPNFILNYSSIHSQDSRVSLLTAV